MGQLEEHEILPSGCKSHAIIPALSCPSHLDECGELWQSDAEAAFIQPLLCASPQGISDMHAGIRQVDKAQFSQPQILSPPTYPLTSRS